MQLDLFKERRKPAEVMRFPFARRKGFVSDTARALAARDHDAGRLYWRDHLRKLRGDLKAIGYSQPEIKSEIDWHTEAVSREVVILLEYRERWPNDAA